MTEIISLIGSAFLTGFGFAMGLAAAWEVLILAGGKGRHVALTICRVGAARRADPS